MNPLHSIARIVLCMAVFGTMCPVAAQTINVDVNSGSSNHYTGTGIVPGDTGTTWNGLNIGSGQASVTIPAGSVKDSLDNTLEGVAITIASSNGTSEIKRYSSTSGPVPNPEKLMQDYTYGGTYNVSVSGLAPGSYKLWFFGHGNVDNQAGTITVNAANGGGSGSTANSVLGRDLINGGAGLSYVHFTDRIVDGSGTFGFQVANFLNGFQLSRQAAPEITVQPPASPFTVAGMDTTLSVTASGNGALAYQWRKGAVDLQDGATGNGSVFSGTTGPTLTVGNTQTADAGDYTVVVTDEGISVASTISSLSVSPTGAPSFQVAPANQAISIGQVASLAAVVTGNAPITYQWQKSEDNGATFNNVSGATSLSYALPVGKMSAAGQYRLIATNALSSTTSAPAMIIVNPAYAPLYPDGFASAVTGGGNLTPVVVTTAAAFKSLAESTAPAVITVSGSLVLTSSVRVKSNKTIQGIDADATLRGTLSLSGVNNVIIRGLNITNPGATLGPDGKYTDGGDGMSIDGATNVFITHCTAFDCGDGLIDTRLGATDVTISWSKFYYSSPTLAHRFAMIADGDLIRDPVTDEVIAGGTPLRMTMHHNWWAENCDQRQPSSTHGRIHMFNNYWNTPGNSYAALARSGAQLFSENNRYLSVKSPLSKSFTNALLPDPLIRSIGNSYTSSTGTTDPGTDKVFTPGYSYPLIPAGNVAGTVTASAGNIAGSASTTTPVTASATITGPTVIGTGGSAMLTAVPAGFAPLSYQWRLNNFDISGATSSTFSITNGAAANAGSYTVALGHGGGETIISAAHVLEVIDGAPVITTQPASQSVSAGIPVTFEVVANGNPAPTYQWYRDNEILAGKTGSSLAIASTTTGDQGSYTVQVTNSIASTNSSAALLTVVDPEAVWSLSFGLDPATNGAPGQDPDRDGLANRIEFLLGGDPTRSDNGSILPVASRSASSPAGLVFRFNVAKAASGVAWSVETNSALEGSWTPAVHGVAQVTIVQASLNAAQDQVTVTVPTNDPKIFGRLRVPLP
jgi:pectate lyase